MTQAVGDTGHTDFMTPEERAARDDALSGSYVGIGVRIDARRRRPARDRRRLQGQPGREGRPQGRRRHRRGRRPGDRRARPSTRSPAGSAARPAPRSSSRSGPAATAPSASVTIDPRRRADRAGHVDAGPGHEDGAHPPRAVLERAPPTTWSRRSRTLTTAGADRIVLDLRGNPGGYVNEAVGVASQFLSSGVVYIERNAAGRRDEPPGHAGRRRDGPAARRPRRRRHRELVGDRVGRAAGRRPGEDRRRDDVRDRARSSASSSCRTGRRCGSAPSSG